MTSLQIIALDPYHPVLGLLVPQVAQRLLESAKQMSIEGDSEETVIAALARLWAKDPTVLMLACVDTEGHVKGHAVASIEGNSAFLLQPRIDEPTDNDMTGELIHVVEQWIKDYNASVGREVVSGVTLIAKRSDPKWAKKYDFETIRYFMFRKLKGE